MNHKRDDGIQNRLLVIFGVEVLCATPLVMLNETTVFFCR